MRGNFGLALQGKVGEEASPQSDPGLQYGPKAGGLADSCSCLSFPGTQALHPQEWALLRKSQKCCSWKQKCIGVKGCLKMVKRDLKHQLYFGTLILLSAQH